MNSSPTRRITLRQVARRLNVSHATVSRALKNDPRISTAMREQVQRTAKAMGYEPDPMLAALSHYRRSNSEHPITAALAWVNSWPAPKKLRTYKEFDLYWRGACEEARRSGYRLEEFNCPHDMSPARLQEVLRARGIRGVLLPPGWSGQTPDWGTFNWQEFCVVRFGYSLASPAAHRAGSDQLSNGVLAVQEMWAKGYRRIGMAMWEKQGTRVVRFSAGYLYAQLQLGPKFRLPPLILHEQNPDADQKDFCTWMEKHRPDAILTDITDIHRMLEKAGYRVPKDIGLAALSVLDGHADAGIYQNSQEIGIAAVQLLISLLHHNQRGIPEIPREVLIPGKWVDGSTLPAKNRRPDTAAK